MLSPFFWSSRRDTFSWEKAKVKDVKEILILTCLLVSPIAFKAHSSFLTLSFQFSAMAQQHPVSDLHVWKKQNQKRKKGCVVEDGGVEGRLKGFATVNLFHRVDMWVPSFSALLTEVGSIVGAPEEGVF